MVGNETKDQQLRGITSVLIFYANILKLIKSFVCFFNHHWYYICIEYFIKDYIMESVNYLPAAH